ncbi:PTS system mannose/fructose/sorbose family transporter subunit IID [Erysipelothrix piscisicarius]
MQIFNTTPHVVSAITGVATALEKEASQNPDFDKNTINSIKISLMGPFAGIGDSFFWGTIRIIATAIALPLSQQGKHPRSDFIPNCIQCSTHDCALPWWCLWI